MAEAFARVDNQSAFPAGTTPYDTLYKDVRRRAPYATYVAMGYPPFFTPEGSDRMFLPGGRCELIEKADQKWMVAKIAEFNALMQRNAERNGFRFANPTSGFLGHELPDRGVPVRDRQAARVAEHDHHVARLGRRGDAGLAVRQGVHPRRAGRRRQALQRPDLGAVRDPNPEPGTWSVKMYGADVNPAGEEVRLQVVQQEPANTPPVAKIKWAQVDYEITLDATGSTDPDGTIASYSWYLNTSDGEQTKTGTTLTFPRPKKPQSVMLAVTDNDGATSFASVSTLPMDVLIATSARTCCCCSGSRTPASSAATSRCA